MIDLNKRLFFGSIQNCITMLFKPFHRHINIFKLSKFLFRISNHQRGVLIYSIYASGNKEKRIRKKESVSIFRYDFFRFEEIVGLEKGNFITPTGYYLTIVFLTADISIIAYSNNSFLLNISINKRLIKYTPKNNKN